MARPPPVGDEVPGLVGRLHDLHAQEEPQTADVTHDGVALHEAGQAFGQGAPHLQGMSL